MRQRIGVLSFHGDVAEHKVSLLEAGKKEKIDLHIVDVRNREDLIDLDGLIIPGGESTTISKLISSQDMWEDIKKIRKIFGTCAGAILLAKKVNGATSEQRFLELMDIEVSRNAYGPQIESFEDEIETTIGKVRAVFIRAPLFERWWGNCEVLGFFDNRPVAIKERCKNQVFLALAFHPELSGETIFHQYFLRL
ncbi:MAG: pyridoxal 5'-phosphate synthase glutaminase subunit PdxT [Candidatus Anstonellales archaeon]